MYEITDSELFTDLEQQLLQRSRANRLTVQDKTTLYMLVQQWKLYKKSVECLEEDGILLHSENSKTKTIKGNPAVSLQSEALDRWVRLLKYFGLEHNASDTSGTSTTNFDPTNRPGG